MKCNGTRDENRRSIEEIISSNGSSPDSLISLLQDIQSEHNHLSEDPLRQVAQHLNLPLIQVYGVATFFKAFSLTPRGEHTAKVCLGTACHVRGADNILAEMERRLGVKQGGTTEDFRFTLETVNCVGACALGPVMVLNDQYHGQMKVGKVKKMIEMFEDSQREKNDEKNSVSHPTS